MHKTAYEMRISYWSSDVCSSDLDANRIVLTDLERRDRDAGLGDDRLLTSDRRHFLDSLLENLAVGRGFTATHVEGDLGDARDFHRANAERGLQLSREFVAKNGLPLRHEIGRES